MCEVGLLHFDLFALPCPTFKPLISDMVKVTIQINADRSSILLAAKEKISSRQTLYLGKSASRQKIFIVVLISSKNEV